MPDTMAVLANTLPVYIRKALRANPDSLSNGVYLFWEDDRFVETVVPEVSSISAEDIQAVAALELHLMLQRMVSEQKPFLVYAQEIPDASKDRNTRFILSAVIQVEHNGLVMMRPGNYVYDTRSYELEVQPTHMESAYFLKNCLFSPLDPRTPSTNKGEPLKC